MAEKGDIYMVFDKAIGTKTLKAIGTMETTDKIGTPIVGISGTIPDIKHKPIQLLATLSANIDKVFKVNESVIVKLDDGGGTEFLYIPGFVVAVVPDPAGGSPTYNIGLAKNSTIIGVKEKNIARNVQLAAGDEGWFFSDTVLVSLLGPSQEITYDNYVRQVADIISDPNGARKIKATAVNLGSESYTIAQITLDRKPITQVKMKSVVPLIYNTPNDDNAVLANPAVNHVVMTADLSKIIFGGKKSRKQKTRKNTMPLQFAPGAKRSYLKRRKSSRK